jgi:hypothetical protein
VKRDYFPYFTQGKVVTIGAVALYAVDTEKQALKPRTVQGLGLGTEITDSSPFELSLPAESGPDPVLVRDNKAYVFVLVKYSPAANGRRSSIVLLKISHFVSK